MTDIWTCRVGETTRDVLDARYGQGADSPMRQAVRWAYTDLVGVEPDFIFSGWGGRLNEMQRLIVDGDKRRNELQRAHSLEARAAMMLKEAQEIKDKVEHD